MDSFVKVVVDKETKESLQILRKYISYEYLKKIDKTIEKHSKDHWWKGYITNFDKVREEVLFIKGYTLSRKWLGYEFETSYLTRQAILITDIIKTLEVGDELYLTPSHALALKKFQCDEFIDTLLKTEEVL